MDGSTHPHVKGVMYNNSNSLMATESTILRGELLPVLKIMHGQFRQARFASHMISPVLLISLMGFKARVLEVYFEDETLVVRPTKLYDFTHGNDAAFKTFTQWYHGKPIGDTVRAS
ncbi:hypothetical protein BDDG_00826 [Blastomyces dermatitidis ATCC 18188]|uniref:Uncharacterized protein n=2 Tax=Ajellomyces dermatitidis TaxID=5039 RepID=F2T387_AJEDA|nr:hypothetical protein BDDG_00826 [Blastomyces dermatitidis ATCC 18188]EQL38183.1 hypothetical protein BDFG_00559 [Blastomyces dermatitidis ATCC 26199]